MEQLKIGILDDQEESRAHIRSLLVTYLGQNGLEAEIEEYGKADALLDSAYQSLDLLFLDVVLGEKNGMEVAARVRRDRPFLPLVIVSRYLNFAVDGYLVKATAYLLKRNLDRDFPSVMTHVMEQLHFSAAELTLHVKKSLIKLPAREILFVEGVGRKCVYHRESAEEKEIAVYQMIAEAERDLAPHAFLRIHKKYLINLMHCRRISGYEAALDNGAVLPCSRAYYGEILSDWIRWNGRNA